MALKLVRIGALYRLTLHQFANLLQRRDLDTVAGNYPSLDLDVLHWLFPDISHTQVCPRCLEEAAYDRLYWTARPVLVCPYHHLPLVQVCPSCKHKIPILRSSVFRCPSCSSGDYRTAPLLPLAEDHPLAVASDFFLQTLGVPLPSSWRLPPHLAPSPLVDLDMKHYFRLLEHIAFEFFSELPQHTLLAVFRMLNQTVSADLAQQENSEPNPLLLEIMLFHWLFTAWPTHFLTGLDALCRTIGVPPYRRFVYGFEQCRKHLTSFFGDPSFSWLQHGYEQHEQQFYRSTWYEEAARREQEEMETFLGWESLS